jgi:hypothetical protein
VNVERHIFASIRGYTTLARSDGITAGDCKLLERLCHSFGNINPQFASANTCFFTSILEGRKALTRVFPGGLDNSERPTVRMVSVVISQGDWNDELSGNLSLLLAEKRLWEWNGDELVSTLVMSVRRPLIHKSELSVVFSVLTDIESKYPSGRTVASSRDLSIGQISTIEMLLPSSAKGRVTCAYGSPNPKFNVTLNCLINHEESVTFRPDPQAPFSPYVQGMIRAGIDEPFDYINKGAFKMARASIAKSPGKVSALPSISTLLNIFLFVLLSAMLIFWYVDHRWLVNESKAESERVTNQGTDTIQSLDQQIESLKSQYAQQANDLQSVRKELQNAKDAGAAQQGEILDRSKQIESLKSQYAQQANDLQSVRKELQNAKDAGAAQQRNKNAVDKVKKARQELLESYDKFFDQLKAANAVQEELKKDDVKKLYDELKDAQKTLKDAQAGLEESEGGNQ